ncbi:GlxA family transcriptional regulator [Agromyces atrinae]|uniref:Transcriptional regulator GlxA family with amidase domain n=2 Tax=Agromyces atrinae TaxID=592376 RepID=A0A852SBX1_9MICO|nr:DJ-1/PfpI family protein [Agromyces atrinae]NYD66324.1 transcriptional regulator GlxA family with amidase domain [Agromyces atrinae]
MFDTVTSPHRRRQRIGFLLFDGVKMLDFVGPAEVFQEANQRVDGYEIVMLSSDGADVTTSMGVRVGVHAAARDAGDLDTLMIPGSESAPSVYDDPAILEAIRGLAPGARRVASVCSGAFALAATGLLDGRPATTHWKFAPRLAADYPQIDVQPDALFVRDGRIYSSAGVAAGIDLALSLVEEDHGAEVARMIAQLLLVYMKRSGGQSQFSASLRAAPPRTDVARSVAEYVNADPTRPCTIHELAKYANVSTRHLNRVVREELGMSPRDYVHSMRLDFATGYLEDGAPVALAAEQSGYTSVVAFRRAFIARLGVTPSEYQRKFLTTKRVVAV